MKALKLTLILTLAAASLAAVLTSETLFLSADIAGQVIAPARLGS